MSRPKGGRNKQQQRKIHRPNYGQLGVSKERYLELRDGCRAGIYSCETLLRACEGLEFIEPYILLSVTKSVSYDRLEFNPQLGRIPVGRTDFYWYRRLFYRNLDHILSKELGKEREKVQVYSG